MTRFEYINTFFNIIYGNEAAVVRDIKSSSDYMFRFSRWLKHRGLKPVILSSIFENDVRMIAACKKYSEIDHILHVTLSEELEYIKNLYIDKTHVVYIPGLSKQREINIDFHEYKDVCFYQLDQAFSKKDLSFFDPFMSFFTAISHVDLWPGVLIFNKDQSLFVPMRTDDELKQLFHHIDHHQNLFEVYSHRDYDSYYVQISDLHLGREKADKGAQHLVHSLDTIVPYLKSSFPLKILITGDLMESPNRKNMYKANDFMNALKKRYKANVTFILGNHDVIVHGLNLLRVQKSKVIAYLLGENIKVLENEKVILIKMDTTSQGNLARGKIGQRQLDEIDDELSAIDHLEDYTMFVMIHHHIRPITKAQFIKTRWHEKTFINKILDSSKALIDAPLLLKWLDERQIHYVFHGHKHLPYFGKDDHKYYIGAGSATGGLKESSSRYISYNIVKYDIYDKKMKNCMIVYDDKAKDERQRVEVYVFEEEVNENSR